MDKLARCVADIIIPFYILTTYNGNRIAFSFMASQLVVYIDKYRLSWYSWNRDKRHITVEKYNPSLIYYYDDTINNPIDMSYFEEVCNMIINKLDEQIYILDRESCSRVTAAIIKYMKD